MIDRLVEESADGVTFVQTCPMCHKEIRLLPEDHELRELVYRQIWDVALAEHLDECSDVIACVPIIGRTYIGRDVIIARTYTFNADYGGEVPVLGRVSPSDALDRMVLEIDRRSRSLSDLKKAESILKGMTT